MVIYYGLLKQFSSMAALMILVFTTMLASFSGDAFRYGCEVNITLPWEKKTFIPEGSSYVFINCTTNISDASDSLRWLIHFVHESVDRRFGTPTENKILNDRGFYELQSANDTIQLAVNNTVGINGTVLKCLNISSTNLPQVTTLLVYEPRKLQITRDDDVGLFSVNLTWNSHEQIEKSINKNYSLKAVTNCCTILSQSFQMQQSHYVFTAPEHAPPCEVYNFSVTATYVGATYTGDGCSVPSPVLSRMLPSLPDIEVLSSSLTYSLVKIDGEVILSVSFESAMVCKDYPVLNYTLEVNRSSEIVSHTIVQGHSIVVGNLSENREYSFRVLAANAVGIVSSTIREFYATDVQYVKAVFSDYLDDKHTFEVACDFISGSDAKGCMVVLEANGENETVNLTRKGLCASRIMNLTFSLTNHSDLGVSGFDIKSDGSVGTLGIKGKLINESVLCIEKEEEMKLPTSIQPKVWIIALIATVIIISIMILLLFGGAIAFFKRTKAKELRFLTHSNCYDSSKCHTFSAQMNRDILETNEAQEIEPPSDTSRRKNSLVETNDEDTCHEHATSKNAKAEDCEEHFYHVLENNASKTIKECSQPPIYQEVFDFQSMTKVLNSSIENQYTSIA